jgi:soluble cytochrome b562
MYFLRMDINQFFDYSYVNRYIEEKIEDKFNILEEIESSTNNANEKKVYELSVHELYQNTMKYLVNVIDDISDFLSINHNNLSNHEYRNKIYGIFFNSDRILYTGIILIFISFIIYFLDNSNV